MANKKKKKKKLPRRLRGWNRFTWTALITFLILGWFFPIIGIIAITCMLAPVLVAIAKGKRQWCVTFCPRGTFNDVILKRISRNQKIPRLFHTTIFKVGFLAFLLYNFYQGITAAQSLADIGFVFFRIISLTTGITIFLGIIFHPRSWCAFCPMGFLSNVVIFIKRAWGIENK